MWQSVQYWQEKNSLWKFCTKSKNQLKCLSHVADDGAGEDGGEEEGEQKKKRKVYWFCTVQHCAVGIYE